MLLCPRKSGWKLQQWKYQSSPTQTLFAEVLGLDQNLVVHLKSIKTKR